MGGDKAMSPKTGSGTLFLVGVGPGDPELLTLKAARVIATADIIAYPLGSEASLARSIAAPHIRPGSAEIAIPIPMRVERGPARSAYDAAAATIGQRLAAGASIAYLCEGDPLFYGSAMYLLDRLCADHPVSIIPGITSLTAAAAAIARPLSARNEVLKILPAPLPDAVLRAELATAPAAAIIKVGGHFDRIRALLAETGHAEGAMVIEHATSGNQHMAPLVDFPAGARPYFCIILLYRGEEGWGRGSLAP
jgi:precorrin-2/cobalt-factor-2 C20-methyltransferase